ncbi:hypothetical protein ACTXQV_82300, partial [Klebsiella pneumoniae]
MTNLLREAITRAAAWQGVELTASQKRLAGVILDEICRRGLTRLFRRGFKMATGKIVQVIGA